MNQDYILELNKILLKHREEINSKIQDMIFENKTIHTVECNIPYIFIMMIPCHKRCDLFINHFEQMVKEGKTGDTGKKGYIPTRYVNKYRLNDNDNEKNIIYLNKILCDKLKEELKIFKILYKKTS